MKIKWLEQKKEYYKYKKGSSIVMLAMVFVAFSICISGAIIISRALVVKSECKTFGTMWTKAIMSEYDVYLLEEYGILSYWGNEKEVQKRIDNYLDYSAGSKLDASIAHSSSELTGLELGIPENFIIALEKGFKTKFKEAVINRDKRKKNETNKNDDREILNKVVIDTLPSKDLNDSFNKEKLIEKLKNDNAVDTYKKSIKDAGIEMELVQRKFNNKVTSCSNTNSYFNNEWEYIIAGKMEDEANYKFCRDRLFIIRNALNLAYLYKDNGKREAIIAVSELLTPGPGAAITQLAISEVWAAAETEYDIKTLLDNDRVPFMKNDNTWKTDLGSILDRPQILDVLGEEGKKILEENRSDIDSIGKSTLNPKELSEGQNYDDYLLLMMLSMNENIRLLRIMDLVQINMKFNHYKDFNLMEYYIGVRYNIKANGKNYEFEDKYQ